MPDDVPAKGVTIPSWALPLGYIFGGGLLGSGGTWSIHHETHEPPVVESSQCDETIEQLLDELNQCQRAAFACVAADK